MTIRNRPNYGVFPIDLTNAGSQRYPIEGTRVALVSAVQAGINVSALVNVAIGTALGDPIPFTIGTKVVVGNKFEFLQISWAAQAGVIATLIISDDADGNGVDVSAIPAVSAGAVSITEGGNTAIVDPNGHLEVSMFSLGGNAALIASDQRLAVRLGGGPVANPVAVTNPALNALPQSGSATAPQVQPGTLGASSFARQDALNTGTTLLAAASNVNGVVIRNASVSSVAGSFAVLCAGTAVPTTVTSNPNILGSDGPNATIRDIFLPPGQGLYTFNGAANNCFITGTYDIL